MKRVDEIMSRHVITVGASDRVGDAIRTMGERDIRHLPVVDDAGRLIGIITDRDLRQCQPPLDGDEVHILYAINLLDRPISALMGREVVAVAIDDPIDAAIDAILQHNVGAVCVIDRGSGALVGIVSYVDLLLALRLEHEDARRAGASAATAP